MLNSIVICLLLSKDKLDLVWDIFNKHLKALDEDIIIILIHDFDEESDFLLTEKFREITSREIQKIREFQPLGKGRVYSTSLSDHFVYSKGFFIKDPELDYIHFTLPVSIVKSVKKLIVIPFKNCTKIDKKTITKLQNFDAEIWCGCDYESYGLSEKYIDRQFKKEEFSNIIEEAISENIKLRSSNEKHLNTILEEIKKVTKHDFSLYKKNTIIRRIERRITANKFRSLKQYTEYIKDNDSETEILHNSLLINVTEFFRDPKTFDYISNEIIPKIVEKSTSNEIKIWVVGCATGEEAYTWCILFREYFEKEKVNKFLKIFATDIDVLTLKEARKGVFSLKKVQNIPSKLLEKYFYFSQDEYHVKTEIRNHIIFAEHNIVQDAPYSKMDMMSCRNVLIYLEKELQHIAFSIFHYSLNDNGYLLLGNTESFSAYSSQFKLIDKQFKIFQKLYNPEISRKFINYINYQDRLSRQSNLQLTEKPLKEKVHSILLDRFSPPSVVVNNKNEILYIQGKTGQFLELSTGVVKNNILKVCKDSLKVDVAELLLKARKSQKEVSKKNIAFRIENKPFSIEICITPITSINSISELFLVSFLTEFKTTEKSFKQTQSTSSNGDHILELENELIATKEYLQTTVEELEKTNEQLETSNEELKSTIEELQSINEELETSQEEIQSINEELKEANRRLEDKIFELSNLNSLLNNLMTSIQMPIIFLDLKLNIFNFTPAINEIYHLVESDKGRALSQFKNTLKEDLVLDIASKVVITNEIQEQEAYSFNNLFYWIKAQPYYNLNKEVDGVVITFSNITTTKRQQEELEVYRVKLENIIAEQTTDLFEKEKLLRITTENFPEGSISLISMKMEILYTGGSIYSEAAFNTQDLIGKSIKNILPESGYNELIRHLPELYSGLSFQFEISFGENTFEYTCKPLKENSVVESFIIVSRNITKQKAALDENLKNLNILNNSLNEIYILNPENLKFEFINEGALQNLGYRMDEILSMVAIDIKPNFDLLKFKELIQPLKDKKTQKIEYRTLHKRKNGSLYPVEVHLQVVETGIYSKFVAVALDITEKEKIEKQKQESEEMASNIANSIPGLVMKYELHSNNEDNISFVSQGMQEIWGISTNEALGNSKLFWKKIHFEDIEGVRLAISDSAKNMTLFQYEFRVQNNELTKWVYLRGVPKKESKGKTSWYMVALDITPLKSIQEELKRTKSLLDHAGNLTKVGGWEVDFETKQIKWSEETRKIFDISSGKILNLEGALRFFKDRKSRVKLVKKIQETLIHKQEFNEDFEILTGNGNVKWIRLIGKPEPDLGRNTTFHGAVIDITAHKQRDEELKLQEKVIKSSKDSVVITKGSGLNDQIVFVNESFSKMTGYSMVEIEGKRPNILYGAATNQLDLDEIEESILKGKSHESELLFYKKSGEQFWVNQYIAPLFLENGEISNFIYIQQDIDEKKKKEIERERIINDLEKLNKEMDNFIYRVSHDLRAPISSALGLINISQKENDIDNIKTYLDIQKNSLNKLDNFIQDILNYSRNTRLKVQANKIEVQELINEITHQLEYSAEVQNIIKTKVKHEYIYYGDELRLSIILTNLISNALKFTKNLNRPPEIIISAKINKKELYLSIEDNGIGIEQKYLNQIYDMFFRATDTNHGSGLGLYIVKDAVNLLKGNIEVESRFMKGTKFTLRIPNGI